MKLFLALFLLTTACCQVEQITISSGEKLQLVLGESLDYHCLHVSCPDDLVQIEIVVNREVRGARHCYGGHDAVICSHEYEDGANFTFFSHGTDVRVFYTVKEEYSVVSLILTLGILFLVLVTWL